ncbi:hypothetical protein PUMCH_003649 [Australozyma saopauloensis]|uniref:Uncharacterized protein n=1 Tax=Australozyma saopauloensis TaxID=291208 RepID=A0AAX4HCP0_9ASCO|nr:hypothetical protein PUMCH_003649 [[Candida] saopauloensis]
MISESNVSSAPIGGIIDGKVIPVEPTDPSIRNGVLDSLEFAISREYENRAFEISQHYMKEAIPKSIEQKTHWGLKRKAASYDVKRVPRILRSRARSEKLQNEALQPKTKKLTRVKLYKLKQRLKLTKLASRLRHMKVPITVPSGGIKKRIRSLQEQLKIARKSQAEELNNINGAYDNYATNKLCLPHDNVRYGNRQNKIRWIPNHVWHAKRFHMSEKWGWNIPMAPTRKCFRETRRAVQWSAVASDTSYFGTLVIRCQSIDLAKAALNTFTAYSGVIPEDIIAGTNVYEGWFYVDDERYALISAFFQKELNSILMRIHPADFEACFQAVLTWVQAYEGVEVDDCRFALGSIELRGPKALLHFLKISYHQSGNKDFFDFLHTVQMLKEKFYDEVVPDQFNRSLDESSNESSNDSLIMLGGSPDRSLSEMNDFFKVNSEGSNSEVQVKSVFSFIMRDPRITSVSESYRPNSYFHFLDFYDLSNVSDKSLHHEVNLTSLLIPEERDEVYRFMHSVKNRTRSEEGLSHYYPSFQMERRSLTAFPVLVHRLKNQAWCVTMPWFFVQPTWMLLRRVAKSREVGLRQMHQLDTEACRPHYPHDYPYTKAGFDEHRQNSSTQKSNYERLNTVEKTSFDDVERPILPGCDWEFLRCVAFQYSDTHTRGLVTEDRKNHDGGKVSYSITKNEHSSEPESSDEIESSVVEFTMKNTYHEAFVRGDLETELAEQRALPVVQKVLKPRYKGELKADARIYSNCFGKGHDTLIGFVTSASFNQHKSTAIGVLNAQYRHCGTVYVRNSGSSEFIPVLATEVSEGKCLRFDF